jgi:hypothetical protein
MRTTASELSQLVRSSSQQLVGALRRAAAENLDTDELTDLLKVAFSHRNQIDAALTGAIGALDRATEKAPDGELAAGLSSVKNGYHRS